MTGRFIDNISWSFKKNALLRASDRWQKEIELVETDFGKIRVLDTKGQKPVILNAPDGPNVIEHHAELIVELSKSFRVICFEFPGIGHSYPSSKFDYSLRSGGNLIINLMEILGVFQAFLSFSCSNGLYAIKAAEFAPEKFDHLFLAQTPSMFSMKNWTETNVPKILTLPIVGQLLNLKTGRIMANRWHKAVIPSEKKAQEFKKISQHSLSNGGCFCLSSLVQGLSKDLKSSLTAADVSSTLVWGNRDISHKKTKFDSIRDHLTNCKIVKFDGCGHFPELEETAKYVELIRVTNQSKRIKY